MVLTPAENGWQSFWRRFTQRPSLPALLLLSLCLLLLDRSGVAFFQYGKLRLAHAGAPIVEMSSVSRHLSNKVRSSVEAYFALAASNAELRTENARLRTWRIRAHKLQHTLGVYEELLHVVRLPESSFLTARVLGEMGGPFERALILQAGRDHGIADGHGVMDAHGLVGRIIGIGDKTSRVLLLTDFNSRIPVLVESSGTHEKDTPPSRGIISGDGSATLRLEYLPKDAGVTLGDRVVTSGDGGFLPAGLLVGMVVAFEEEQPLVEPAMVTEHLEWVRVFTQASRHDVPPAGSDSFSETGATDANAPLAAIISGVSTVSTVPTVPGTPLETPPSTPEDIRQ